MAYKNTRNTRKRSGTRTASRKKKNSGKVTNVTINL